MNIEAQILRLLLHQDEIKCKIKIRLRVKTSKNCDRSDTTFFVFGRTLSRLVFSITGTDPVAFELNGARTGKPSQIREVEMVVGRIFLL